MVARWGSGSLQEGSGHGQTSIGIKSFASLCVSIYRVQIAKACPQLYTEPVASFVNEKIGSAETPVEET